MISYQWYCTVDEILVDLGIDDPGNLLRCVRSASMTINRRAGDFIPVINTYEYDDEAGVDLYVDPLLSIASIVNYATILTTSDYTLFPRQRCWLNGPYSRIHMETSAWTDDIVIAGTWGKYSLAEALGVNGTHSGATDTTLTTSAPSTISPGMILLIESELIAVAAAITDVTFTVIRGINGTTAAAHAAKAVYRQMVPDDVNYLAREMAALAFKKGLTGFTGQAGNELTGDTFYINEFPSALKKLAQDYRIGYL